jgi:adenylate cyclase
MERRLAAILAADVAGYSRLMGRDEEATLRMLTEYRQVMDDLVTAHRGRVFGTAGDSMIAEFASPVEAVRCAVDIQRELGRRAAPLPEERRMRFRIGVNLGDVMAEGGNLFGDGVNLAARLEKLAEPGGILISANVHDQVRGKLAVDYDDLGAQRVRNMAQPVRAYRVRLGELAGPAWLRRLRARPGDVARRWAGAAAVLVALSALAGGAGWRFGLIDGPPSDMAPQMQAMSLPLPDKPSIAVLPLQNLSGDRTQDYFSDGITNDITTELSKFGSLFVIASNSAFTYKNTPVKVQEVGRDLGVRYLLEGTVNRADERLRINAQLIDAATGHHLWAERYDRPIGDVFRVQDEIIRTVVATLAATVDEAEQRRAMEKEMAIMTAQTEDMSAYDYYLRGRDIYMDYTKEANAEARSMFERAIEADPNYARAYGYLAYTYIQDWRESWTETPDEALETAYELARKAVALDGDDYDNHWSLAVVQLFRREFDEAMAEYERALSLNPNDADVLVEMGEALTYLGRPDEAVEQIERAMRLNPKYDDWYLWDLGFAHYQAERYEEALAALKRIANPANGVRLMMASAYAQLGREDEARSEMSVFLENAPDWTIEWEKGGPFKNPADEERWVSGAEKAAALVSR